MQKAGGQETGDIVKFYNEIFVHSTKTFLLQIGTSGATPASGNTHGSDEADYHNGKGSLGPPDSLRGLSMWSYMQNRMYLLCMFGREPVKGLNVHAFILLFVLCSELWTWTKAD